MQETKANEQKKATGTEQTIEGKGTIIYVLRELFLKENICIIRFGHFKIETSREERRALRN